jgi:hypothetical protein
MITHAQMGGVFRSSHQQAEGAMISYRSARFDMPEVMAPLLDCEVASTGCRNICSSVTVLQCLLLYYLLYLL